MGLFIAFIVFSLWLLHLAYSLLYLSVDSGFLVITVNVLIQGYLYTGLFITAHDAMHGTVCKNKTINNAVGAIASFLFAGMSYNRLVVNHKKHHVFSGTEGDPDFFTKNQNFFVWLFVFMKRYTTITQIIIMAILFNVLKIWVPEFNIWMFWVIPAFLGTLQLFYFGTFQPHRYPHSEDMMPHRTRTLKKNHFWAMLSCYFFGYHSEHHANPKIPWWKLYINKK